MEFLGCPAFRSKGRSERVVQPPGERDDLVGRRFLLFPLLTSLPSPAGNPLELSRPNSQNFTLASSTKDRKIVIAASGRSELTSPFLALNFHVVPLYFPISPQAQSPTMDFDEEEEKDGSCLPLPEDLLPEGVGGEEGNKAQADHLPLPSLSTPSLAFLQGSGSPGILGLRRG